jgi:transcription-repair coupling factor (superfamily II helicase)
VEKIDAGPKGVVIAFRDNSFANPDGLIAWLSKERDVKLRPDFRLVFMRDWDLPEKRLKGTTILLKNLVTIAEAKSKAA